MAIEKETGRFVWIASNADDDAPWHYAEEIEVESENQPGRVFYTKRRPVCGARLSSPHGATYGEERPSGDRHGERVCLKCDLIEPRI